MTPLRDRALAFLSTGLGLGYAPRAPGTAGTLLGVIVFIAIGAALPHRLHAPVLAAALALACALALALGPWAERAFCAKDPPRFVLDEVAGFLLTVLLFRTPSLALTAAWAFAASRTFDIAKPPPARRLARLRTGWGMLADDLVASLYAAGALHVLAVLAPNVLGATVE